MKLCKRTFLLITTFFSLLFLFAGCVNLTEGYQGTELFPAQFNDGCHDATDTHNGFWLGVNTCAADFKLELHNRIKGQRVLRYKENAAPFDVDYVKDFVKLANPQYIVPTRFDVWDAYVLYAYKGANPIACTGNKLYDYYAANCYTTPTEILSQNGGGDQNTYNREHSWPKSWFAAGATPKNNPSNGEYCYDGNTDSSWDSAQNWDYRAFTDLHHLIPADGAANTARSNNSLGLVDNADGGKTLFPAVGAPNTQAKLGKADVAAMPDVPGGGATTVFEPADVVKGDLARIYFYMATRYYTEDGCWQNYTGVDKAHIKPWLEKVLRQWHTADPVSAGELARNDWIERIQGNRNPFIDHPEWVAKIADF